MVWGGVVFVDEGGGVETIGDEDGVLGVVELAGEHLFLLGFVCLHGVHLPVLNVSKY
jgi:hypothetical protein